MTKINPKIPEDIEFLVSGEGAYIEIETFINFLRNEKNVPDEYRDESKHLQRLADYLEDQFGEILAQKVLMNEIFNKDRPN